MSQRVTRSVSLAIRPPDAGDDADERVLLVRRPPDDVDLPNVWGLPAASLTRDESWEDAARRAARGKLGVDVAIGRELSRGTKPRAGYTLEMRLFEAAITRGEPAVPQPAQGVTQYTEWRWGRAPDLVPAAERGSLCCRLYLEHATRIED